MKNSYGGYIELDTYRGVEYHGKAIALNCGRNALIYLIEQKNIKIIYLPYFICSSVTEAVKKTGAEAVFYHIDKHLRPIVPQMADGSWLYVVNYYGQLSDKEIMALGVNRIIVDHAQDFFRFPIDGVDTLYTCRKFFGVADGAYLYTDIKTDLEQDYSYDRMRFLLGRYEKEPNEFYKEYVENNRIFNSEPVKAMSKLTHNLLRGIDYEWVKSKRTENFTIFADAFSAINKLELTVPNGAFMYPLYIEKGAEVRKRLQEKRIYIPTLWADVTAWCEKSDIEYDMANNILPLPVDQRYDKTDIAYIISEVKNV